METIEIDKDRRLNPGDVVLLHFMAPGGTWIKAAEAAMVESALERRKDFKITSIDYLQPGKVIFEIEVLKTNPVFVTTAIIVGSILTMVLLAAGWMFEKAELVVKAPATKVLSAGVLIIAGIVLFSILKGKSNVIRS